MSHIGLVVMCLSCVGLLFSVVCLVWGVDESVVFKIAGTAAITCFVGGSILAIGEAA